MNTYTELELELIRMVEDINHGRLKGCLIAARTRIKAERISDDLRRELLNRLSYGEGSPDNATQRVETLAERCARLGALLSSPEGLMLPIGEWHDRCAEWRSAQIKLANEETKARLLKAQAEREEQERVSLETDAARWRTLASCGKVLRQWPTVADLEIILVPDSKGCTEEECKALTAFVDGLRAAPKAGPVQNCRSGGCASCPACLAKAAPACSCNIEGMHNCRVHGGRQH